MEPPDPAPALGRGLALIRLLDACTAASLEELASRTGWPKSSTLRLLTSLCRHGVAHRDPDSRRYSLRERLLAVPERRLRSAWDALLAVVGDEHPHTLELHAWDGAALTMVDRREPAVGALRVHARIGWRRGLDEFDALTQLVLAHGGIEPGDDLWVPDGARRRRLAAARRRAVLAAVAATGAAADLAPNSRGAVRSARPVLAADGGLLGIIASAQVARAGRAPDPVPLPP